MTTCVPSPTRRSTNTVHGGSGNLDRVLEQGLVEPKRLGASRHEPVIPVRETGNKPFREADDPRAVVSSFLDQPARFLHGRVPVKPDRGRLYGSEANLRIRISHVCLLTACWRPPGPALSGLAGAEVDIRRRGLASSREGQIILTASA